MPRATSEPTTAAAPTALPRLPPFPSIAEIGKRIVAISAHFNALENASLALPRRLPAARAAKAAKDQIDVERDALTNLICARCAESLEDAAVQAAVGFQIVDYTLACELEPGARDGSLEADLTKLHRMFASITVAVAKAAEVNLDDLGWGDSADIFGDHAPTLEVLRSFDFTPYLRDAGGEAL